MVAESGVMGEIRYRSGGDVSTETSSLKRREQKENATFASTGYYIHQSDSECPDFEWGL